LEKTKEIQNQLYQFLSDGVSFSTKEAFCSPLIYAPLCGIDSTQIKSSITPHLSGDIKIDKNKYLTNPASREDLRNIVRNFYLLTENEKVYSLGTNHHGPNDSVEIGMLWHKISKSFTPVGLTCEATNFVPVSGQNVECMSVRVTNTTNQPVEFTPTFAIPLFCRTLANKHDHAHVTALFNRVKQIDQGVVVNPSMIFNEEGHKECSTHFFVLGCADNAEIPMGTFPTVESFIGQGTWELPESVSANREVEQLADSLLNGQEAVGGLRFKKETLGSGAEKSYYFVMGIADDENILMEHYQSLCNPGGFQKALDENKIYWQEKIGTITFQSGDIREDAWMKWVTLQPILRRIFGCSFLPDHDYGKGGKGWRDIWQDLLSLILIEPRTVRETLINNFAGVRIDGTNATIVGDKPGEFSADRNFITRVWMDHGVWPYLTLQLYIDQTGDYDILLEKVPYFRDMQFSRTFDKDVSWSQDYGQQLKDKNDQVYQGTILEHILIQHLVQFFNVGEHNIIRLENADWNDGLDMAFHRGESVAFMSMYAGNLISLADLLDQLREKCKISDLSCLKEIEILCDSLNQSIDYNSVEEKKDLLFKRYFTSVQPTVDGKTKDIPLKELAEDLRKKGEWVFQHIHQNEKVEVEAEGQHYQWFNGYYDNDGKRVEGMKDGKVWMTLTGQVFSIMSGCAKEDEIPQVHKSVTRFLIDEKMGGVRLNSDFGVSPYLSLGRAFGFAYGTKENGAFFSHMGVMYAYALYKRGFAREGYEVLKAIYDMGFDTAKSRIYPGVPEYFDANGRGMYHYLTGSASWLVLTKLTQCFGVRGSGGDLILEPKLVKEQFDDDHRSAVECTFAEHKLNICYINEGSLDYREYKIGDVTINGELSQDLVIKTQSVVIGKNILNKFQGLISITIKLNH